jgi:hypothetical protein
MTSVISLTLASAAATLCRRARVSSFPSPMVSGMRATVTSRPARAGHTDRMRMRRAITTMIWGGRVGGGRVQEDALPGG